MTTFETFRPEPSCLVKIKPMLWPSVLGYLLFFFYLKKKEKRKKGLKIEDE
jgi:hypothetical protein